MVNVKNITGKRHTHTHTNTNAHTRTLTSVAAADFFGRGSPRAHSRYSPLKKNPKKKSVSFFVFATRFYDVSKNVLAPPCGCLCCPMFDEVINRNFVLGWSISRWDVHSRSSTVPQSLSQSVSQSVSLALDPRMSR